MRGLFWGSVSCRCLLRGALGLGRTVLGSIVGFGDASVARGWCFDRGGGGGRCRGLGGGVGAGCGLGLLLLFAPAEEAAEAFFHLG